LGFKKYFGEENKEIEDSLLKKGFFIIRNARSNYTKTVFSMSSILNMEYLPESENLKEEPATIMSCQKSISQNSLFSFLKLNNYKIKTYQPFAHVDTGMNASLFLTNLKNDHYFYKTLAGRIHRDLFWNIYKINLPFINAFYYKNEMAIRAKRKRGILNTTASIEKSCSMYNDTPVFYYGHYNLPHYPYTLNEYGETLPVNLNDKFNKQENKSKLFYQQVLYANRIINEIVTFIQKNNKKNTVIIIMGDHGYRGDSGITDSSASYNNFGAIYFPDKNYKSLHDSLSSVNIFRSVLNRYFNTKLPMLKHKSFNINSDHEFDL